LYFGGVGGASNGHGGEKLCSHIG